MIFYSKMWWLYLTIITYLTISTTGEKPKIVIVGAGASGVAAASKLYANGFQDVTILEAEDRIGGRVFTTWFDEYWVDVGAQWVHGQMNNNIVYELAEPLGLLELAIDRGVDFAVHNSEGTSISPSITSDILGLYLEAVESYPHELIGKNGSAGEYITSFVNAAAPTRLPAVNETLLNQFLKLMEGIENVCTGAENWYDSSVMGFSEFQERTTNYEVNWKIKGFGTILDILTKKIPNPENELPVRNNTKLNSEVVNIDHNSTEGKVLVELKDGQKYTADHVIVTTSLGVLKQRYETLFTPKLPESKIKTIKGLSIGNVAKLYMSFESPWWPSDSTRFLLLWNDHDKQEYESDPKKKWLLDINAFFAVSHKPRLLCGWMAGPGTRYMHTLPEDQVLNQTLAILHKFFAKSYNISTPTGFLRSRWDSNKHFRGSFSYRSTESERADVWAAGLATPLLVNDKPIVQFAGEATHSHHYGTVHGAIEAGFREANRLINLYNLTTAE